MGGIAAIRLVGAGAASFSSKYFLTTNKAKELKPFYLYHGSIMDNNGNVLDEVMAVTMPDGKSYTGLEQVEIYCHGGREVVRQILNLFINSGARPAEPGEFTRLAFENGRIDLVKAEAVAEVISANTETSLKASREHLLGAYTEHIEELRSQLIHQKAEIEAFIDFGSDIDDSEDIKSSRDSLRELIDKIQKLLNTYTGGRLINEGFKIAIAGRPNAGKSSFFNLLLKNERALVNPTPGTTRDYLSEWIDLAGYAVNLIDTAGLRKSEDQIEKAGQSKAIEIMNSSDLVIWMIDLTEPDWQMFAEDDLKNIDNGCKLLIGNKIDLLSEKFYRSNFDYEIFSLSCISGQGLEIVEKAIIEVIKEKIPDLTDGLIVTSARHQQKLKDSIDELDKAIAIMESSESIELAAFHISNGISHLDEITGKVYNEEILGEIFSSFCIGK